MLNLLLKALRDDFSLNHFELDKNQNMFLVAILQPPLYPWFKKYL